MAESKKKAIDKEVVVTEMSETERLRKDIFRSDMDKFLLFTKMLRTNALYNKAKIAHK